MRAVCSTPRAQFEGYMFVLLACCSFVDSHCDDSEVCVMGFCSVLCNIQTSTKCPEGRTCIGGRCHTNCQTDDGVCVADGQAPWLGQCHPTCDVCAMIVPRH